MFLIPLLVLSFGIINIHAQECEDVKMKMSLTKSGRVELDVDQLCRCAGYSKSPTTEAPDLSKWKKKPTTDGDVSLVTEKPTKDKSSTFKDIDEFIDVLTENTTDITTETSSTEKDTDTEKIVVIDKSPIVVTTEETKDKATEKRVEITHKIYKNMTTDSADKVTEKTIFDKDKNSTLVIEKLVVKKSTGNVTKEISSALTTDKDIDIDDKTDVITEESPSDWMTESLIDMITVKSVVDKFTVKNSSDMVTDKGFIESDRSLTTEIVDKSYLDKVTESSTDFVTEKTAHLPSRTALGTSHMTKKSGNKLQILLILLAIMVMAGLIFAVCYTVYMSHRSNSYVLPSPDDEATPLNNI